MSLTSFIQEKEVREKFLQTFSTPIIEANKPMLAPKVSFRHSMIGTAFDYLLRFYLERVNDGKIVKTEWIANKAMAYLDSENQLKAGKIIEGAKSCLENCLQSGFITNDLINYSVLLAELDMTFRAGVEYRSKGIATPYDIKDLRGLISIINRDDFKAREICMLNPDFGEASAFVGGADADIIIDDRLVDVKTTKTIEMRDKYFHQLIGYYILSLIESDSAKPKLNEVKIYFSRYAYFWSMKIDEIISQDRKKFMSFAKWFERKIKKRKTEREQHQKDELKDFLDNATVETFINEKGKRAIKFSRS